MNKSVIFLFALIIIVAIQPDFRYNSLHAQYDVSPSVCVGETDRYGNFYKKGEKYVVTVNGVTYDCIACVSHIPRNSKDNTGIKDNGSQTQMEGIIQPIIKELFDWLFSEPTKEEKLHQEQEDYRKEQEEREREREEYRTKMLNQISNVKSELKKLNDANFNENKDDVLNDIKEKVAKSEATKALKQANCNAFYSLQATKTAIRDFSDFKDLEGPAEQTRKEAELTDKNLNECPEIKIDIREVNASQTVSLQEIYYNYILDASENIKIKVDSLKVKKTNNDKVIEEKKQKVEEVTKVIETKKNQNEDQDYIDALKELENAKKDLETAEENDKKMKEEIELDEKNISTLEEMRSLYDKEKNQNNPEKP